MYENGWWIRLSRDSDMRMLIYNNLSVASGACNGFEGEACVMQWAGTAAPSHRSVLSIEPYNDLGGF